MKKMGAAALALALFAMAACNSSDSIGADTPKGRPSPARLANAYANRFDGFAVTDGEKIYFCSENGIGRLEKDSWRLEATIPAKGARCLSIDGDFLYFALEGQNAIYRYSFRNKSKSAVLELEGECVWLEVKDGKATYLERNAMGNILMRSDLSSAEASPVLPKGIYVGAAAAEAGRAYATVGSALMAQELGGSMSVIYDGSIEWLQIFEGRAYFIEAQESIATINALGQGYQSEFVSTQKIGSLYALSDSVFVYTVKSAQDRGSSALFCRNGQEDTLLFQGRIEKAACLGSVALVRFQEGEKHSYAIVGLDGSCVYLPI